MDSFGRSDFGRGEFGRSDLGGSDLSGSDLGGSAFDRSDFGRSDSLDSGTKPDDPIERLDRIEEAEEAHGVTVVRRARDRIGVHLGWEFALLLAVATVGYLLYQAHPDLLRSNRIDVIYVSAAVLGFTAVGMALSLRAGAPNLAIGTTAQAAGMFFADNSDRGLLATAGVTALLALAVGVAMAVVVTAFHVPAWAVSLATAFGLLVWIQQHHRPADVVNGAYQPTQHAAIWFAGFVVISVAGGILGLMPSIRRRIGMFRPLDDPALRGSGAGAAVVGLLGSSLFAAVSGVLLALYNRAMTPVETGIGLTGLALGAALLGGTSVFGRRGGVFGTALSVIGIAVFINYALSRGYAINPLGLGAAAIAVGLLVTRLVETLGGGRPLHDAPQPAGSWESAGSSTGTGWSSMASGGTAWTDQPAARTDGYSDRWGTT